MNSYWGFSFYLRGSHFIRTVFFFLLLFARFWSVRWYYLSAPSKPTNDQFSVAKVRVFSFLWKRVKPSVTLALMVSRSNAKWWSKQWVVRSIQDCVNIFHEVKRSIRWAFNQSPPCIPHPAWVGKESQRHGARILDRHSSRNYSTSTLLNRKIQEPINRSYNLWVNNFIVPQCGVQDPSIVKIITKEKSRYTLYIFFYLNSSTQ